MAFDVKKWLVEDMKFSAAEAEQMAPSFTAERLSALESGYVGPAERQKIAAREKDIEKTQAELSKANEKLNAEMAEWATLTAQEKSQAGELQKSLEAARVRTVQLETRLTQLANDHGVDPKGLLEGTAVIPEKKEPVVPPVDTSKFVSAEAFNQMSAFNLQLPARLQRIAHEHHALTGEYLDTEAITGEILTRAKKGENIDPVAIWESMHDIPAKRAAKAKAELDTNLKAAEQRGYDRGRSEAALPAANVPGRHAPVFNARDEAGQFAPRTSKLSRPQPGSGVRSAAAALATHKYRPQDTGAR